jgi:hypothetical protein
LSRLFFFSSQSPFFSLREKEKLNPAERTRLKSDEEVIKGVRDTYRDPTELVSPPHLRTETDLVAETLYSLVFRIPEDGQSPKTQ